MGSECNSFNWLFTCEWCSKNSSYHIIQLLVATAVNNECTYGILMVRIYVVHTFEGEILGMSLE